MGSFSFKKIKESDLLLLSKWLEEPHVKKWWPILEKDELLSEFLQRIRSKDTFGYIVNLDDKPIGYIQYYFVDGKTDKTGLWLPKDILTKSVIGTDQFIGDPNKIGKGHGTKFIKEFIEFIFKNELDVKTVIVDPDPKNIAAIRCYEKIGFKKVNEFDVSWGKALLMQYDK